MPRCGKRSVVPAAWSRIRVAVLWQWPDRAQTVLPIKAVGLLGLVLTHKGRDSQLARKNDK